MLLFLIVFYKLSTQNVKDTTSFMDICVSFCCGWVLLTYGSVSVFVVCWFLIVWLSLPPVDCLVDCFVLYLTLLILVGVTQFPQHKV